LLFIVILSTKCEKSCFEILHFVQPSNKGSSQEAAPVGQDDNLLSYKVLQQITYKKRRTRKIINNNFSISACRRKIRI